MKRFPGSKTASGVIQWLINQIPPHQWLIEPFGGMATLSRTILPAKRQTVIERDEDIARQLRDQIPSTLLHENGIIFLEQNLTANAAKESFVYTDPPYVHSSRGQRRLYRYELSDRDHIRLCEILLQWPGNVAISGYSNPIYKKLLGNWRTEEFQTMTRGGLRTEILWMNYAEPKRLHDYRFLGEDRTDRQRIRRKIERAKAKLAMLPPLERQAIIDELTRQISEWSPAPC